MVTILGKTTATNNVVMPNTKITIKLVDGNGIQVSTAVDGQIMSFITTLESDVNGDFSIQLFPNDLILSKYTKYEVAIGGNPKFYIYVQDTTSTININELSDNYAQIIPALPGAKGDKGYSAYELAVIDGFVGTEIQWIASLVGEQGIQGPQGIQGIQGVTGLSAYEFALTQGFVGTEAEWLISLIGATGATGPTGPEGPQGAGMSAYELAVSQGYVGTLSEWLITLIGPQGPQGPQGLPGADGLDGANGIALNTTNIFTAPQIVSPATLANAINFTLSNGGEIVATAANITIGTMAVKRGQEGSFTIKSAENVTGWGTEFRFAPDFSAVTPTPPTAMTGTMEFWYKIIEINGVDGGTANIIHIAWAK